MGDVLVNNPIYEGKFVALKSFKDNTVVGSGDTAVEAFETAKKKGENDPVILFVPVRGTVFAY